MWVQRVDKVDGTTYGPIVRLTRNALDKYESVVERRGRYGIYLIGYPKPTATDLLRGLSGYRNAIMPPEIWLAIPSMAGGSVAGGRSKRRMVKRGTSRPRSKRMSPKRR